MMPEHDDPLYGPPRFTIGEIEVSKGVGRGVEDGLLLGLFIDRHWRGDWGRDTESNDLNDRSIVKGKGDVVSEYSTPYGAIWIRTTLEDKTTTVSFRDEL